MKKRPKLDRMEGHTFVGNWLGPESVVLDCGMNAGVFARRIGQRYRCRVIGIEANPTLAEQNRAVHGLECHNLAVCGCSGTIRFRVDTLNPLASAIVDDDASGPGVIDVRASTLADILQETGCAAIDLLKLDIESAELDVIRTTDLSIFSRIPQMAIEFHAFLDQKQKTIALECIARLEEAGFYHYDFSMNLGNVLFINKRDWKMQGPDRLYFVFKKYSSGLVRTITQTHQ